MFIFKKLRKSNKGFSLVELIITVAMMSIVTAGIGTALVSATQSYNRGTAEVDLQTDSQNLTNIITNLIIDSTNVTNAATSEATADYKNLYIKSTPALSYTTNDAGESVTLYTYTYYAIKFDSATSTIMYGRSTDSYSEAENDDNLVVLAENVSGFSADASTFSSDFTVHIDIDMYYEATKRSLQTSFSVTSRNAESDGANINADGAIIVVNSMMVVEPNETSVATDSNTVVTLATRTFDVLRSGNVTRAQANIRTIGVYEDKSFAHPVTSVTISNIVQPTDDELGKFDITVDKSCTYEKVYLYFGTVGCASGSSTPYDEKWVTVYIRRVNKITVSGRRTSSSYQTGRASSTYTITSNLSNSNVYNSDRFYAFPEDDNYVNPYNVIWEVTGNSKFSDTNSIWDYIEFDNGYNPALLSSSNTKGIIITTDSTTTLKIKLTRDMPIGGAITFTCYSAHAYGNFNGNNYNKTGLTYGTIKDSYTIKRTLFDDGFKRGNAVVINHGLQPTNLCDSYLALTDVNQRNTLTNAGMRVDTFMAVGTFAYDADGTVSYDAEGNPVIASWSPYVLIGDSANCRYDGKIGCIMLPTEDYYVEQILVAYNPTTKTILWPHDDRLLRDGMGFKEAGYSFDTIATKSYEEAEYCTDFTVARAQIIFTGQNVIYKDSAGAITYSYKIDEEADKVGSFDSPLHVSQNYSDTWGITKTTSLNFNVRNMQGLGEETYMGSIGTLVQKYNAASSTWSVVGRSVGDVVYLDSMNNYSDSNWIRIMPSNSQFYINYGHSDSSIYRVLFFVDNYEVDKPTLASSPYTGDVRNITSLEKVESSELVNSWISASVKADVASVLGQSAANATGYLEVNSNNNYLFPMFYDLGTSDEAGCVYITFD